MLTAKNNGVIYFGKNVSMSLFLSKIKTNGTDKTQFGVKMFSKKLYGRLPDFAEGCYGNW
jgi:hypothetical protein